MTRILYPSVRYDGVLENGFVTCKAGSKEIKSAIVADEEIEGLFGGGDHTTIRIPLWQFLSHKEKKAIRFTVKLYQNGDLAELQARWNDIDLNRIINKIVDDALHTQHESRTTRKGLRYGTFGNERSKKPGFAGTMETERQT